MVLSQNKVLQRFLEQIIDDLCLDRVQQRFEDLERPVSFSCSPAAPFSVVNMLLALSHLETWTLLLRAPLLADTCPRVHRQSTENCWKNFLSFS